jgi:hypothetical protein
MVSLVKKLKNMYKGSYYYANKKYGKYTKRRPFPNFNDFDCSPSGDFSLNEVPDMNTRKMDSDKKNSYINTSNDNSITVVNEGNNVIISSSGNTSPATGDILGLGNESKLYSTTSNSVSPVSTISDNTDFTMVNGNSNEYSSNNPSNPFQSQNETKNPFNDVNEISFNSGYSTTFDGMYPSSTSPRDFTGGDMSRRSCVNSSNDDIKYEYNGKNNWNVEIRRYYPSMPQTDEPVDYHDDFKNRRISDIGVDMKKKKWWKKVIPSIKNKHHSGSVISENTYYNDNVRDFENNPKRYDSRNSSYYTCYNGDRTRSYSNMSNTYDYNCYNENLTDGVLVINDNYQSKKMIY